MQTNLTTANDNVPLGYNKPLGYDMPLESNGRASLRTSRRQTAESLISISKFSPVKRGVRIQYASVPAPVSTKSSIKKHARNKTGKFPVYVLLLLWGSLAALIARFAGGLTDNVLSGPSLVYAAGGMGLLSLLLAFTARRRGAKISHSIGLASLCVCTFGIIWYYWQTAGMTISAEFLTLGCAASSLILAKLWRASFYLHLSLLMTLGWSAYAFLDTSISDLAWLFPALWSMQMFLALEFRFRRTIALSIFTGLVWIGVNLFLLA